ncbi:Tn7 transposase TnsA N-terminal domain-containing protein [Lichenibacterium dinghuense]|uniref:Tn7 transposase TnsA N-terminal domain-containing protein n=1 Tax=Lichenibacterium dinghuense TaxID=2895977 RepID=UPI001F1D1CF7|nr:Tn7 transposase TnsA N-terminal domain-containing protein [Lichenibacterium sp. 6Y81]
MSAAGRRDGPRGEVSEDAGCGGDAEGRRTSPRRATPRREPGRPGADRRRRTSARGGTAPPRDHGASPTRHDFSRRVLRPSTATRIPGAPSKGSGRGTVVGPDLRKLLAESFLEYAVMLALLACTWVRNVWEQPTAVRYVAEGRPMSHTFDLLLETTDGRRILVEVKPSEIADREGTRELVDLIASQLAVGVADAATLVTELQVPPDVLHDADLISSSRRHPSPDNDRRFLAALPVGGATIAETCVASGLRGEGMRAAARLIGAGALERLTDGRIAPETVVAPRETRP